MVNGSLQCIGTNQHLKAKYGEGYILEIRHKPGALPAVQQFVSSTFPSARETDAVIGRVSFTMPGAQGLLGTIDARLLLNGSSVRCCLHCRPRILAAGDAQGRAGHRRLRIQPAHAGGRLHLVRAQAGCGGLSARDVTFTGLYACVACVGLTREPSAVGAISG